LIDRLLIQSRSILTHFSFVYKFNHALLSIYTHTHTQDDERSYAYIQTYIHPLFLLQLPVVVVVERRCENNNLSRMFGCVSGDMLRSYYRRGRQRTHTIQFFLLQFFSSLLQLRLLVYITFFFDGNAKTCVIIVTSS
jgi:hypothetical protein